MTNRRSFLLAAAMGGLAAPPLLGATQSGTEGYGPSPEGLRAHLVAEMQKSRIPGMQVAVVRHDHLAFFETFGFADVENSVPATAATRFQLASCTKAFVGVALMQLVEGGMLNLDTPASHYLGGLPASWQTVTVAQVATHMSGLPDITTNLDNLRLLVDGDAEGSWAQVQQLPMQFPPGERFSYNQTNYVLLGKLIDALSGVPFEDFIRRHQLHTVGMPRTVFGDDHDVVFHSAKTYTPYLLEDGKPRHTDALYKSYIEFPAMLRTCGGLNSTADELARWLLALQRGRLLKKETSLATLRTARMLNSGKPGPWGIGGAMIQRTPHPVFFSVGAAKSAFGVFLHDNLSIVVLTNLSADLGLPFIDDIAAFYLPHGGARSPRAS
jgi:CubicO group peptidase (beta-lactamase class C family)